MVAYTDVGNVVNKATKKSYLCYSMDGYNVHYIIDTNDSEYQEINESKQ